ncbi:MAG: ABC transporter ATP-binding protein [Bauldia sp.]
MLPATGTAAAAGPSAPPDFDRTVVSLRAVAKTFSNGVAALRDLDLDIREGEFLSLLGPSGCGKSTALRLIAGLGEISGGSLFWSDGPQSEISFVFQEPTLMPWATVASNVWLPLRLRKVSKATAQPAIEEALGLVGLSDFAGAYPRQLSGGMKMRVSIARALVTRPRLLLMDEPFAALDEITRFRLNDDLLRLWQKFALTVVFVTHSVFESVYLSTRLAVMSPRPGRIFAEFPIAIPYPRDTATRSSPDYADHCRRASEALQRAMSGQDAAAA